MAIAIHCHVYHSTFAISYMQEIEFVTLIMPIFKPVNLERLVHLSL